VYSCSKVGWSAHPVPGHGKKSGYATATVKATASQQSKLNISNHTLY